MSSIHKNFNTNKFVEHFTAAVNDICSDQDQQKQNSKLESVVQTVLNPLIDVMKAKNFKWTATTVKKLMTQLESLHNEVVSHSNVLGEQYPAALSKIQNACDVLLLKSAPNSQTEKIRFQRFQEKVSQDISSLSQLPKEESTIEEQYQQLKQEIQSKLTDSCTWTNASGVRDFNFQPIQGEAQREALEQTLWKKLSEIETKCDELKALSVKHPSPALQQDFQDFQAKITKEICYELIVGKYYNSGQGDNSDQEKFVQDHSIDRLFEIYEFLSMTKIENWVRYIKSSVEYEIAETLRKKLDSLARRSDESSDKILSAFFQKISLTKEAQQCQQYACEFLLKVYAEGGDGGGRSKPLLGVLIGRPAEKRSLEYGILMGEIGDLLARQDQKGETLLFSPISLIYNESAEPVRQWVLNYDRQHLQIVNNEGETFFEKLLSPPFYYLHISQLGFELALSIMIGECKRKGINPLFTAINASNSKAINFILDSAENDPSLAALISKPNDEGLSPLHVYYQTSSSVSPSQEIVDRLFQVTPWELLAKPFPDGDHFLSKIFAKGQYSLVVNFYKKAQGKWDDFVDTLPIEQLSKLLFRDRFWQPSGERKENLEILQSIHQQLIKRLESLPLSGASITSVLSTVASCDDDHNNNTKLFDIIVKKVIQEDLIDELLKPNEEGLTFLQQLAAEYEIESFDKLLKIIRLYAPDKLEEQLCRKTPEGKTLFFQSLLLIKPTVEFIKITFGADAKKRQKILEALCGPDEQGNTILHQIVSIMPNRLEHLKTLKAALTDCSFLFQPNIEGNTPFHLKVTENYWNPNYSDYQTVEYLMELDLFSQQELVELLSSQNREGKNSFHIHYQHINKLIPLIKKKITDPQLYQKILQAYCQKDNEGNNVLLKAIKEGYNLSDVKKIIEEIQDKKSLFAPDREGNTICHVLASREVSSNIGDIQSVLNTSLVEALEANLLSEEDLHMLCRPNAQGNTPLHLALMHKGGKRTNDVKCLLEKTSKFPALQKEYFFSPNSHGDTPLLLAVKHGSADDVKTILDAIRRLDSTGELLRKACKRDLHGNGVLHADLIINSDIENILRTITPDWFSSRKESIIRTVMENLASYPDLLKDLCSPNDENQTPFDLWVAARQMELLSFVPPSQVRDIVADLSLEDPCLNQSIVCYTLVGENFTEERLPAEIAVDNIVNVLLPMVHAAENTLEMASLYIYPSIMKIPPVTLALLIRKNPSLLDQDKLLPYIDKNQWSVILSTLSKETFNTIIQKYFEGKLPELPLHRVTGEQIKILIENFDVNQRVAFFENKIEQFLKEPLEETLDDLENRLVIFGQQFIQAENFFKNVKKIIDRVDLQDTILSEFKEKTARVQPTIDKCKKQIKKLQAKIEKNLPAKFRDALLDSALQHPIPLIGIQLSATISKEIEEQIAVVDDLTHWIDSVQEISKENFEPFVKENFRDKLLTQDDIWPFVSEVLTKNEKADIKARKIIQEMITRLLSLVWVDRETVVDCKQKSQKLLQHPQTNRTMEVDDSSQEIAALETLKQWLQEDLIAFHQGNKAITRELKANFLKKIQESPEGGSK